MMNEIYAQYAAYKGDVSRKIKRYDALIERHERAIERHRKARDKLYYGAKGWCDLVVVPLANAISERLGGLPYKVYGPFGLDSQTSIYFFATDNHDIWTGETYNITLYPCGTWPRFAMEYDTGMRTKEYPVGSIGWYNNFNVVHAPLPDDLDDIMKLIRHSRASAEEAKDENNQGE